MLRKQIDQEEEQRGVKVIRYADDIVILTKSKRAVNRLWNSVERFWDKSSSSKMNMRKSKAVSVVEQKHFKFLGVALAPSSTTR
nr:reverse transcriptase domain-containing protein [Paenibacillus silvae]